LKRKNSILEGGGSSSGLVSSCAEQLGTRIKAVIKLIGTKSDAAKYSGVSSDMLYRYVRGQSKPSFEAMIGIAQAAGVNIQWLATGQGDMMAASQAHYDMTKDALLNDESAAERRSNAIKGIGSLLNAVKKDSVKQASSKADGEGNKVLESSEEYNISNKIVIDQSFVEGVLVRQSQLMDKQIQLMDKLVELIKKRGD